MHKIAVIDDDEYWCLAIKRFLRNTFEVSTFSHPASLLKELEQEPKRYDLLMVDLSLPTQKYQPVDGRKLLRYIRETLPEPPLLVLVTAFISKNELDSGKIICSEADAFLAKDAGLDVILQRLQRLLGSEKDSNGRNSLKSPQRARW
jgi:CheY-like chemotaxis protein